MYLHNSAMRVGLSLSVLVIIGLTLGGVPSGSVSALPSHRQVQKLATPIGIAAVTSARQEVTIQSDWDRTTAVHPLAIDFCSMECKDEYMARLFAPEVPCSPNVRHCNQERCVSRYKPNGNPILPAV